AWATAAGYARRSPVVGIPTPPPARRGPGRAQLPPRWAEHVAAWTAHQQAGGRAPSTIDLRRRALACLAATYADPWDITGDDLTFYLARTDWSPETKRSTRSSLSSFYRWAVRAGRTDHNPTEALDGVRVPRALPRPTPDEAVWAALAAADDRTRLMILLAGLAGLRRSEIAAVHTDDLDMPGVLRVRGKGGRDRLIPLHPDLAAALNAEVTRRRTQGPPGTGWTVAGTAPGWLFPGYGPDSHLHSHMVGKYVGEALPAGWTAHTLRHRFATQAYGATRDLRAVQELLGHSKPETTARYAAVPDHNLIAAVAGANMNHRPHRPTTPIQRQSTGPTE
uniref:tyrosine-type recombinase/integrase n=1 Tax=Kribbia dieselivorans TaxID=331526 RepID=UPI000838F28F